MGPHHWGEEGSRTAREGEFYGRDLKDKGDVALQKTSWRIFQEWRATRRKAPRRESKREQKQKDKRCGQSKGSKWDGKGTEAERMGNTSAGPVSRVCHQRSRC